MAKYYFSFLILVAVNCFAIETHQQMQKAMFDEDFFWLKPSEADNVLDNIKNGGFNVFVPCVWHGRGVSWNSELAPKEPRWLENAPKVKDPLKMLIEKAHALGIEVHPWFTVVLRQRDIFPEFARVGSPDKAFNVHNPEYREYIIELMLEVVRNYDIQGINLDYIRSMGVCLSKQCIDQYKEYTGRNLLEDYQSRWDYSPGRTAILEWNENAVTKIVSEFSRKARKIKPNLLISVDTHPVNKRVRMEGANAIRWANDGYIDLIYDMQYKKALDIEKFNKAKQTLNDKSKIALLVGNFERSRFNKTTVYPREASHVSSHMEKAKELGLESQAIGLYTYKFFTKEQMLSIK